MNLQFPGYDTEFSPDVYSRQFVAETDSGILQYQGVLLPQRYTIPSKSQIIDHIVEASAQMLEIRRDLDPNIIVLSNNLMRSMLGTFPLHTLKAISEGEKYLRKHLEESFSVVNEHGLYLKVSYGEIPSDLIIQAIEQEDTPTSDWFLSMMSDQYLQHQGWGFKWSADLALRKGALPPREVIDVLVDNETTHSATLSIICGEYPSEIKGVIEAVYRAIRRPRDISELPDVSWMSLEQLATLPLQALHNRIRREQQQMDMMGGPSSVN